MLKSYKIDDPMESSEFGSVEVTIELSDGHFRWCTFVTAEWLVKKLTENNRSSWWLFSPLAISRFVTQDGTEFDMTHFPQHMIVVSQLSDQIIAETLQQIDMRDEIEAFTTPLRKNSETN